MANEDVIDLRQLEQAVAMNDKFTEFLDGEAGVARIATSAQKKASKERSKLLQSGVELSEIARTEHLSTSKGIAYYYLPIPLTVFPPPGTFIEQVEIELQFNPGSTGQRPLVHDIFPQQAWQDQLKIEGGLQIGINEAAQFVWSLVQGTAAASVVPMVKTLLKLEPASDAQISLGEFTYLVRKPIIMTSVEGADIAKWRFSGRDHFEQAEHLRFGLILAIPRELKTVHVAKLIRARRRNQSFSARLAQDLERLQQMRSVLRKVFADGEIEFVLDQFKRYLRNEWNIVQDDLPLWDLSADLVH